MNETEATGLMVGRVYREYEQVMRLLRQAETRLRHIGTEYGMTYGDDIDDALSLVTRAIGQTHFDRGYLCEFVRSLDS